MKRRRLAVAGAAVAAIGGEWLGHNLSDDRVAGLGGLTTGIHRHTVPMGVALHP